MRELRLLPAAVLLWLVVMSLILTESWPIPVGLVLVGVLLAMVLKEWGQALLVGALTAVGGLMAWLRLSTAKAFTLSQPVHGTVTSTKKLDSGAQLINVQVPGYPVDLPVFLHSEQEVQPNTLISVAGKIEADTRVGIGEFIMSAQSVEEIAPPRGYAAWVNNVRDNFQTSVVDTVGESSQGLIPGMVLGDKRLQDVGETQLYIDTGLSHLSAVSGSNVAILVSSVVVVLYFFTFGPRVRVIVALLVLGVYLLLVGGEPSVLRAAATGMVSLLAVLNSSRIEPIHGLSLAMIFLLLWDSDLAIHFGFILSVTATAGIILFFPLLYKACAKFPGPDILIRAIAVAIAADLVTLPIIALMSGKVSMVAVLANVLVDAAVAPVTLIGLIAVVLSLLPGSLEFFALKLIEPFTWWIFQVATRCQQLPRSTLEVPAGWLGIAWVLCAALWIIVALHYGLAKIVAVAYLVLCTLGLWGNRAPPQVDPSQLQYVVIDHESEISQVPAGTELIIVTDPAGRAAQRPIITPDGVPVLYPQRDGEVTLHVDGSQHASDGRF
ncbi:ComEC/Rec2 family competence protein [Corynebacterium callunae]|uniref:ComEC/Rec2 family competence protein n=1 Tax=Corynebacterium callunae TaxID=1721 RepID=UPI003981F4C0